MPKLPKITTRRTRLRELFPALAPTEYFTLPKAKHGAARAACSYYNSKYKGKRSFSTRLETSSATVHIERTK